MTTPAAFSRLLDAADRHLRQPLSRFGFAETKREPEWYGGSILFARGDLGLRVVHEFHDMGLGVYLGLLTETHGSTIPSDLLLPGYTDYTSALGIADERFRDACGGWRSGYFYSPQFAVAFDFVASTLPAILPRQREIESALRERDRPKRKGGRARTRRRKSSGDA